VTVADYVSRICYRVENLGARLRVNLFEASWIARIAGDCGMVVDRVARPFVHNMVVRVGRPAGR
jgi:hypothetical protein